MFKRIFSIGVIFFFVAVLNSCSTAHQYPMVEIMKMEVFQQRNAKMINEELNDWSEISHQVNGGSFKIVWGPNGSNPDNRSLVYSSDYQPVTRVFINGDEDFSEFVKRAFPSSEILEEHKTEVLFYFVDQNNRQAVMRIIAKHNELVLIVYSRDSEINKEERMNWVRILKEFDLCENVSISFIGF